jgi:NADH-quinone oxidoreductase subunit L
MHEAYHASHSHEDAQDMRNMGGLRRFLPITFVTMGISTLAISGIPPFAGFFSKDEIIGAAWTGMEGASPLSAASLWGVSGATWMAIFGVLLSIAAFLTAFYMGRLMVYTFFGPNRTGEVERHHLHEVGWTMTVPLVVLAALATVGGLINVEDVPVVGWFDFGQGAALERWLHPVLAGAEEVYAAHTIAAEPVHAAWPILLAIAIGVAGLLVAWFALRRAHVRTADEEPDYTNDLGRVLYHKWYVDELYGALVVRPVRALSNAFYAVVDRGTIDGIVDDVFGYGSVVVGLVTGRIQSGQLNTYAFMIVLGVLAVLGAFLVY